MIYQPHWEFFSPYFNATIKSNNTKVSQRKKSTINNLYEIVP